MSLFRPVLIRKMSLFRVVPIRKMSLFRPVLIRKMSLFRAVPIRKMSLFRAVLIRKMSLFQGCLDEADCHTELFVLLFLLLLFNVCVGFSELASFGTAVHDPLVLCVVVPYVWIWICVSIDFKGEQGKCIYTCI